MKEPSPGQTINIRLKQEFGGAKINGKVDSVGENVFTVRDAFHESEEAGFIGSLVVNMEAVESLEVVC